MAPLPPTTWPVPSPRRGNWFHSGQIPSQPLGAASPVMWAQILSRHTVEGDMGTHCPWARHARGISGDSSTEGALSAAPPSTRPPTEPGHSLHSRCLLPAHEAALLRDQNRQGPQGLMGYFPLECE